MKKKILIIIVSCLCLKISAQDNSLYKKVWYTEKSDTMPYRILLPKNFDASRKYPLILFLHGAGERGNDNELQLVHGASFFLRDSIREKYPAIIVFPQCPKNSFWSNVNFAFDSVSKKRIFNFPVEGNPTSAMRMLLGLVSNLQKKYSLDKHRMYVGGLSMGGMGTFELVRRKPKLFAAAFPICGGGNPASAKKLIRPDWWIFHGLKDDVVDPEYSRIMREALKNQGAKVKITLYPDANHNSWDAAFAEKDLMSWLFSSRKNN